MSEQQAWDAAPVGPADDILIAGGGVAGWSAAALLARTLSGAPGPRIRVLDLPVEEAAALSALPTTVGFHARLGLDEGQVLGAARGTFRLGTRFEGLSAPGDASFEPFGGLGAALGGAPFQHALGVAHAAGEAVRPEHFSLAAVAASLGRFAHPSADPRSVLSTLGYSLHLETAGYAALLRRHAVDLGVQPLTGELAEVEIADGRIDALRLSAGERLTANLFVDATGPAARLLSRLAPEFEDWRASAPFDRQLELMVQADAPPAPFSTVIAHRAGWRAVTPLQGAVGHTFAYASSEMDEAAAREALATVIGAPAPSAKLRARRTGRRPRAWVGNCVALGAAASDPGRFDLELHLTHSGAERLVRLLPTPGPSPMAAAEFNRLTAEEMARLRDFSLLPLRLNGRRGEPLWDRLRESSGPETLEYRIALFASRGRVALFEGEVFPEDSWVAVLLAHGVWPARGDVRVDAAPPGVLQDQLRRMKAAMQKAAEAMPTHADTLAAVAAGARR